MKIHRFIFHLVLFSFLFPQILFSQENEGVPNNDSVYSFVDQQPEFPGGLSALSNYLNLNLLFPEQAIHDSIEGKIYIGFVVEIDGSISNVKVLRGIGGGCDQESIRVISEMPAWTPGKLNGKTVRVSKILPITFSLAKVQPSQSKIYLEADTLPSFVGGLTALFDYLDKHIAKVENTDSTCQSAEVNVYFVVETNGSISNVGLKDSVGCELDEKAKEIVQNMPKWKPGKIGNTNVRVLQFLSIDFSADNNVYQVVEDQPEFPGGMDELYNYLALNVKYPPKAKRKGIQGRVFVNFTIEKDGSVSNISILMGIGGGCDEEALRVVKNMPRWTPGMQKGKAVRVSYNLPIKFTLQKNAIEEHK